MVSARESSDPWAHKAAAILDRVAQTRRGLPHHIDWALAYLGDKDGPVAIPRDLMGNATRRVVA